MASLGLQSKYNKLLDMAMGQARDRHAAWKQQQPTYDPFSTSQSREYNARQQKKRDVKEMGLFQEGIDTRKQGLLGKQQLAQGAQLQLGQTNRANILQTGQTNRTNRTEMGLTNRNNRSQFGETNRANMLNQANASRYQLENQRGSDDSRYGAWEKTRSLLAKGLYDMGKTDAEVATALEGFPAPERVSYGGQQQNIKTPNFPRTTGAGQPTGQQQAPPGQYNQMQSVYADGGVSGPQMDGQGRMQQGGSQGYRQLDNVTEEGGIPRAGYEGETFKKFADALSLPVRTPAIVKDSRRGEFDAPPPSGKAPLKDSKDYTEDEIETAIKVGIKKNKRASTSKATEAAKSKGEEVVYATGAERDKALGRLAGKMVSGFMSVKAVKASIEQSATMREAIKSLMSSGATITTSALEQIYNSITSQK